MITREPFNTRGERPLGRFLAHCYDCDMTSDRDWLTDAGSDADWHNTNTGHNCEVWDNEREEIAYRP